MDFEEVKMLHEVEDGFGLPMPVSLKFLRERYGKTQKT